MANQNQQPNLNMPSFLTINNNKNMMNEPIFKNYTNPMYNGNIPQMNIPQMTPMTQMPQMQQIPQMPQINTMNPTPIAPMNSFLANTSNMIIQPNLSLATTNPINTLGNPLANPLGNYVQIPVMIANRPPTGNWAMLDNMGNMNENMALNNIASSDAAFLQGSASNMQKIFDNNIFIQQGNNSSNAPINNPNNQSITTSNNQGSNSFVNTYLNSFQEFETRMFNIIKNQNRTLQNIKEDNDKTHETLNNIKKELNLLKLFVISF